MIDASAILLQDGLSATIRFRLSSLSVGPDAMETGVVFAGCTISPNGLPMAHPHPVARPLARSGRDGSVSSAYALRTAGGRRWRPWCRTSE
ncbi:MAG: hypothetical protein HYX38_25670 [Rhodospirillales bacterium]|nr:hypothetical protein [Rhodospirillales bacterium]